MSLVVQEWSLLTLRPSVAEVAGVLRVRDSALVRLLRLGAYVRSVDIDFPAQEVRIAVRWLWFGKQEISVPFSEITHLDYTFDSVGTSWGGILMSFGRQDQLERFTISVVTQSRDTYELCRFSGEGAVCTGWTGVLLDEDSMIDFSGTQESESRSFANSLSQRMGVSLGKQYDFSGLKVACPSCGQQTANSQAKCLYCGASLVDESQSPAHE